MCIPLSPDHPFTQEGQEELSFPVRLREIIAMLGTKNMVYSKRVRKGQERRLTDSCKFRLNNRRILYIPQEHL